MTSRSRGIRICTCNNYFEGPERPIKMFDFSDMNCETCSFVRLVAYLSGVAFELCFLRKFLLV